MLDRWAWNEAFALAHQAVPGYLDWYYSMLGPTAAVLRMSATSMLILKQRLSSFLPA